MVGVVGSSPIEPTNEKETSVFRGFERCRKRLGAIGEFGYDTANVDRYYFGTTLVEDQFRHCSLLKM
jgi:hypothetical protein